MMRLIRQERARRAAEAERERVIHDAERIRARCQTLAGFVREAWPVLHPGTPYVHGWHIDAICEHLEAITDGRITRLLINVPPGTMKSLLVSVFWPAWEWTFRPELQYLTTSYSEGYVKRDSRRMRDLVTSDWYQALWPLALPRTAEISFENSKRGFREGKPFASLTGGRGDRVIIDDPHSTETAESEADRATSIRVFRESVPTRLNDPERSAIIVIMQRLHEEDISGQIIKLGLGYEHLMLPMEFEPDRRCSTSIGFIDPREDNGELLFPERFPRHVVERDKVPMGSYAVAGQLQQRPAPRSGGMFQRGDFEIVDAVPAGARHRCRAWDFAASKEKPGAQPDWTVGLRMVHYDGIFYVEDVRRDRWTPGDVEKNLKNTASRMVSRSRSGCRKTLALPASLTRRPRSSCWRDTRSKPSRSAATKRHGRDRHPHRPRLATSSWSAVPGTKHSSMRSARSRMANSMTRSTPSPTRSTNSHWAGHR